MLAFEIEFERGRYDASDEAGVREDVTSPSRVYCALTRAIYCHGLERHANALRALEEAGPPEVFMGKELPFEGGSRPDHSIKLFVPIEENMTLYPHEQNPWGMDKKGKPMPPSTYLEDPRCVMVWRDVNLSDEDVKGLEEASAEIYRVGRGSSLARVHRVTDPDVRGLRRFVPDPRGEDAFLKVPTPGTLDALNRSHAEGRHFNAWSLASYREIGARRGIPGHWNGMLRMRVRGDRSLYLKDSLRVMDKIRSMVISMDDRMGLDIPSFIHGHDENRDHVAFVPLPFVGHEHANGTIKGVGVLTPRTMGAEDRRLLTNILKTTCTRPLRMGGFEFKLEMVSNRDPVPQAISAPRWCRPSRTWTTVTPVVLTKPPKKNRPVPFLVHEALRQAGLPDPEKVEYQRGSFLGGSVPETQGFIYNRNKNKQRNLPGQVQHLRVTFPEMVSGPVCVGRMRHLGLGLMLPEETQP